MKTQTHSTHGLGIVLMVVGVMLIPVTDAMAKHLSAALSIPQITGARFLLQAVFVYLFMRLISYELYAFKKVYFVLGAAIGASILFLFWGLKHLPLANNIALFFIEPLVLTLLSALFLKEKIQKVHLFVIGFGLLGTVIILRPNLALYGINAVFPLLAATFYALYLVLTRRYASSESVFSLQVWVSLCAAVVIAAVLVGIESATAKGLPALQIDHLWWLLIMGAITAVAHVSITKAFTFAPAGTLAPFQYLEIVGAVVLGWLFFDEIPDTLTALGAAVVVASGLYLAMHERKSHNFTKEKMKEKYDR
ncbi:MAG: DMT family transporter [Campylobacterota bacterium]